MAIREARKYTHSQDEAATTWTITHNLGIDAPIMDCFIDVDGAMTKVLPASVVATSKNVATVTWSSARAGKAVIV